MTGNCPTCRRPMISGTGCPRCVQLSGGLSTISLPGVDQDSSNDTPRFFRRLFFGLVTVFGLFAGLDHLALSFNHWIAFQDETPPEQFLIGILLLSCLIGCLIAGTANRMAELTGLTIGILAALGHLWQLNRTGESMPGEWFFGFPLMAGLVGVMAGFAGRLMYPPAPNVSLSGSSGVRTLMIDQPVDKNPIVIWRILLGTIFVVAGTYYAGSIQFHFSRMIGSKFGSFGASNLVIWQLVTLISVLGGVIAGTNTHAGFKQGLITGFFSGIFVSAMNWKFGSSRPMGVDFWDDQLSLNGNEVAISVVLVTASLMMCSVGGWLGSRLLQPVKK